MSAMTVEVKDTCHEFFFNLVEVADMADLRAKAARLDPARYVFTDFETGRPIEFEKQLELLL